MHIQRMATSAAALGHLDLGRCLRDMSRVPGPVNTKACVYIYVYKCICVYIYIYSYTHIQTFTRIRNTCSFTTRAISIYIHIHLRNKQNIYIYIHIYIFTCVHVYYIYINNPCMCLAPAHGLTCQMKSPVLCLEVFGLPGYASAGNLGGSMGASGGLV